jgi:hypothetical protein
MDGTNGPCEVCSPNRALAEIPNPLLHSQNFGDLPQDESGFKGCLHRLRYHQPHDLAGCSVMSSKDERMSDTQSGAVLDESVAPGLFNDGDAESKPSTTIKRIFIPTLLVM